MSGQENQEPCTAHHAKNCEFANAAAEKAVEKTFAILGVNIKEPKEVSEFQDSLRFGKKLFRFADHGVMVMVGAVALLIVGALVLGIKAKIVGP